MTGTIAKQWAKDWFTKAPEYRTEEELAQQIQLAIDEALAYWRSLQ
jgi:hypothetical protein